MRSVIERSPRMRSTLAIKPRRALDARSRWRAPRTAVVLTGPRGRSYRLQHADLHLLEGRLRRVTAPALVLCGRHDGLVPLVYGERWRDRIAGARLEVI